MTWIDRILVAFARLALRLLALRCSPEHQRAWWPNVSTFRARPAMFPDGVPEVWPGEMQAGVVRLAFGSPGPRGFASPPPDLVEVALTRTMLDMFIDGAIEMRNMQDIQLANLHRGN